MKINKVKLKRQEAFIQKWIYNSCKGSLQAVTGFGKTYVAVLIIKLMNSRKPQRKTIVVVPTLHLQDRWNLEIKTNNLKNVEVIVINTAIKKKRKCSLLVLDEIHNYAASENIKIFTQVKYSFIVGLTATMERSDKRDYLLSKHCPVLDTINLKEALANKYVSNFMVFNLGLTMDPSEKKQYGEINKKFHAHFAQFDHEFFTAQKCLTNESYRNRYAQVRGVDPRDLMMHAAQFNRNMQARKRLLYNLPSKAETVNKLIKEFPLKTITFAETIDFAMALTEKISTSRDYNSRISKKQRKKNLEDFQSDKSKVNVINTAKALDEGFDVDGIEMAIISSGTSTKRQDLQRTGRAIRFQEDKISIIINLYVKDTQDERWLSKRQSGSANIIYVNSIDEIKEHISGTYKSKDVSMGKFSPFKLQ